MIHLGLWLTSVLVHLAITVIAVLATLARLLLLEALRIYRAHSDQRVLWWLLGALGAAFALALALRSPQLALAALGGWWLAIEIIDLVTPARSPAPSAPGPLRRLLGWLGVR